MAIRVLDQHTAELIAAGEVVERPSSVVKELVENAIDAGAKNITVDIERGGIQLMRVADDGGGIAAEDIPLAFLRHATSKVRTAEDLDAIHTLGFRGEALASIASVARVELLTKTEQDEFASLYCIEGGREQGLEPAARPLGTTMAVKSLFYNTPARMKFLKKDTSEGTYVTETVTRLALSHPAVAFRYTRDGKPVFATPGDGKLESAVYAVLGAEFARELLRAEGGERQYRVHGLVTPPREARASRSMQFFFINGRFVKNRTMMAALEQAYRGLTMHGKYPGCVLFLEMPPELVDVNVHPAKTEVRFAREGDVFDAVYKAVKAALLANLGAHGQVSLCGAPAGQAEEAPAPGAGAGTAGEAPAPAPAQSATMRIPGLGGNAGRPAPPPVQQVKSYNNMVQALASESTFTPYEAARSVAPAARPAEQALSIEPEEPLDAAAPVAQAEAAAPPQQTTLQPPEDEAGPPLRLVGEVFKTYILAEAGSSLCLIDKHAAHERMIYEDLVARRGEADIQQLLAPVTVNLSAAEKDALLQNGPALAAAGLEVEDFGGNGVVVRGVPADVEPASVPDLVVEVAARMALNARDTMNEKTEWVLHSVACRAAVKAGDHTAPHQLLKMAQDILSGAVPPFCPHGRPVVLELTRKELEKQFGRLG